jgi:23S rRNA (pseudouridine1915-N3)-methyltransferase
MRLIIAAVGRLKEAERELCTRYVDRMGSAGRSVALGPLIVIETPESKAANVGQRQTEEAQRLLRSQAGQADVIVVLDGGGQALTSEAFAALLARHRDRATGSVAFLVGGPDGHGAAAFAAAHLRLSLGPMTLPHGFARIVLAEQIFRAATILSRHPYHRT